MQVKTASISSESNPNQCNHPPENDSFSPRIEKQSSSRLVLLGLIPLKHKLGWAIVCIIICSLFFLNFCLPRKLENCSNRAIDWLLSNEASQVKTAPISEPPSPLPCPLYFQNHQYWVGSSIIRSQISKPGSIPGENSVNYSEPASPPTPSPLCSQNHCQSVLSW